MERFTTRVELHSATPEDYETLHEEMEAEGFTRLIKSDDGVQYHLPTAEYNKEGEFTTDEVLDSGIRAATRTGKKFSILVTQAKSRKWFGLKKVN